MATLIDVGKDVDGGYRTSIAYTVLEGVNPANATGKITSVKTKIYFYGGGDPHPTIGIGFFYNTGGNDFKCRTAVHLEYTVAPDTVQTFTGLDLNITAGDLIGLTLVAANGAQDITVRMYSAGAGNRSWRVYGNHVVVDDETTYDINDDRYWLYIYGTGVDSAPDPPTNVQATDGNHNDKVVVTWTKSTGATDYQVYRDGTPLGWLGDVATYNDTGAGAPSITPGAAIASDGTSSEHVSLNLDGESANNGVTYTYKVKAKNIIGESGYSGTDTGYRGVGTLMYQWQRSAADSDENYSNIDGATTESYNDIDAPASGVGRYYKCVENATGAVEQTSTPDRGYKMVLVASKMAQYRQRRI